MTNLVYLSECSSTQDEIHRYMLPQILIPTAVYTFSQTKGKGQYGNSWESSKDLNIAYSLAFPANKVTLPDAMFNFRTAEVLADFLANLTAGPVEIKWPNDILIKNKKIAGILIERKMVLNHAFYMIGIGLNVLQKNFSNLPKAGSLLSQTGKKFELSELTSNLHEHLITQLQLEITAKEVLQNLNSSLFRKNIISVFEIEGIRQNGIIKEVEEDGLLVVDLEHSGLQKFFHKEIQLLY